MALADLRPQLVRHAEEQQASTEQPGLFYTSAAEKVAVAKVLARCVPLLLQEPEISAAQCKQLQDRYAAQAAHELAEAIRLGFADFDSLGKDSAFDSVRRATTTGSCCLVSYSATAVQNRPMAEHLEDARVFRASSDTQSSTGVRPR